jgi:hypothetical protein
MKNGKDADYQTVEILSDRVRDWSVGSTPTGEWADDGLGFFRLWEVSTLVSLEC